MLAGSIFLLIGLPMALSVGAPFPLSPCQMPPALGRTLRSTRGSRVPRDPGVPDRQDASVCYACALDCDSALLVRLRNDLVHCVPEGQSLDLSGELPKVRERLYLGGGVPKAALHPGGTGEAITEYLGASTALWASQSARRFADEFCNRLRLHPIYQQIPPPAEAAADEK